MSGELMLTIDQVKALPLAAVINTEIELRKERDENGHLVPGGTELEVPRSEYHGEFAGLEGTGFGARAWADDDWGPAHVWEDPEFLAPSHHPRAGMRWMQLICENGTVIAEQEVMGPEEEPTGE